MAFLMPNKKCEQHLNVYFISIDSLDRIKGIDFFPKMNEVLETKIKQTAAFSAWKTQGKDGDVEPLKALELSKGVFNTEQAAFKV